MKPLSLSRLNSILERKEHSALYGKNGLIYPKVRNEKGFKQSESTLSYENYVGCIETDTDPIIFTTDGTYSAIGFYSVENDLYTPIFDDSSLSYKLNLNPNGFIQGEARRNYLGEIEIVWLESNNVPRFLNTAKPTPTDVDQLNLFTTSNHPSINLQLLEGGFLKKGAYYTAIKYISEDGAETGYFTLQGPVFAYMPNYGGLANANSPFSLRINLTNLDTNYSRIQIAIISNIDGIISAKELDEVPIPDTGEFFYVYANNNLGTDITLEEILIPTSYYENAKAITQENDILYLGNTTEPEEETLQQYFIPATVKWTSREVSIKDPELKSGEKRSLKHGEVYAFYAVIKWKNGRTSKAFTLPGPVGGNTNKVTRPLFGGQNASVRTALLASNWVVTASSVISRTAEGTTLPWVNENENYPDTPEYGIRSGMPVTHHILPTVGWCADTLYSTPPAPGSDIIYGVTSLDILGVKVENISFPPSIQDRIQDIEIYFAKREFGSTLVNSQGILIPSAISTSAFDSGENSVVDAVEVIKDRFKAGYGTNQNGVRLPAGNPYFTGTNLMYHTNEGSSSNYWTIPFDLFYAFHSPETLGDKFIPSGFPALKGNGILVTKYSPPPLGKGSAMRKVSRIMDSLRTTTLFDPNNRDVLMVGEKSFYLISDQKGNNVDNAKSEGKLIIQTLQEGENLEALWSPSGQEADLTEEEYLTSADSVNISLRDAYPGFYTRELVKLGTLDSGYASGGDVFICEFSFNTMGIYSFSAAEWVISGGQPVTDQSLQWYRRVIVESNKNLWLRFNDPANPSDKFFPANISQITPDRLEFPNNMEINAISLPISSSAISDKLNGIIPNNPWDNNVYKNPFKIIRSKRQQRENKYNSWRTFLALDYFETVKDKGEIINLQGFDGNLIIHHLHAVYQTVSKTTLNGDILSVTLGSGDIFQLEPKEGKSSKTGIGGLQNPLYTAMTDYGYIFVDSEKRIVYVINERGLQPLNGDLDPLFKEILKGIDGIPFNSTNGICIGYDDEELRLLFTFLNGDKSLTFSMDIHSMQWAYSHDYFPNAYITTRNKLLNVKEGAIHRFNEGNYGTYYGETFPYYIDIAFVNDSAFILNSVVWRTLVEDTNDPTKFQDELYDRTFTSITIWNGNQCTGKISLNKNLSLPLDHNTRSPEYKWNFNKFRNLVKDPGQFLNDIFSDFRVIDAMIKNNLPWHQKDLILGDYVIVRFEFDNSENKQITINDLNIDISKSYR